MPSGSRLDKVIKTLGGQSPPVSGYLTYNPGPGIYSRLERAVEAMPENVRVQELPGLLKRYKEGVPGWELKATDLDSTIAGRDVVPRDELLAAVRERSPVYTHGEVILGGRPQIRHVPTGGTAYYHDFDAGTLTRLPDPARPEPDYQFPDTGDVSRLGEGVSHGEPKYRDYGQGGKDYSELLLTQPNLRGDYGSHWDGDTKGVVAHARFDTHGDALRINELQSDLGIHNRRAREAAARPELLMPGELGPQAIPFPLEDAWADILIKRLALEAARGGHRAIEIASPRAIADKVGGNIDNYEHFYGKVVPGALERLGRKMGGLTPDIQRPEGAPAYDVWRESEDLLRQYRRFHGGDPNIIDSLNDMFDAATPASQRDAARNLYGIFYDGDHGYATARTREALALVDHTLASRAVRERLQARGIGPPKVRAADPGRRYIMSDEMRKRILTEGIPAAIAIGIGTDQVLGRLDGQSPQQQMR